MPAKETLLFHYKLCTFPESTSLLPVWDVHKNIRFLALSEFSLSFWFSCSNLTDYQAQRKFLPFNQAIVSLSFLYLFTRIAPPPPILFCALSALSNHPKKSASLVFTEFLFFSPKKNSVTSKRPAVLFYTKLPHQAFPPFPPFGTSMQLHSSSSFAPPSLLHTHSHKHPMDSHATVMEKNIHCQNQDGLIIPKHTFNVRVFTLCGNPLWCDNGTYQLINGWK